ncbi:YD repeat-containing protein [Streptomyces canus]|nr:YD repeat-containing protein [Streptomyces canus]MDQ1073699.1 YD repeat-containing protein [Streptomyces canus]
MTAVAVAGISLATVRGFVGLVGGVPRSLVAPVAVLDKDATTTVAYEWDAAGNRTTAGSTTSTFDARNLQLTDGSTAQFACVVAVFPDLGDLRLYETQAPEHVAGSVAVLDIGGRHRDHHRQAERVHGDMSLAAVVFFAAS